MSVKTNLTGDNNPEINFREIQDIIYWSRKWEISPQQLVEASQALESSEVKKIENYLREKGFAI